MPREVDVNRQWTEKWRIRGGYAHSIVHFRVNKSHDEGHIGIPTPSSIYKQIHCSDASLTCNSVIHTQWHKFFTKKWNTQGRYYRLVVAITLSVDTVVMLKWHSHGAALSIIIYSSCYALEDVGTQLLSLLTSRGPFNTWYCFLDAPRTPLALVSGHLSSVPQVQSVVEQSRLVNV